MTIRGLRIRAKAAGVYVIICLISGKIYIGSSKNLAQRLCTHAYDLKSKTHINPHLQHAWNKYGGDQFICDVLEYCPVSILAQREQWYMDTFKAVDPDVGYNIMPYAFCSKGKKHTLETRKRISVLKVGEERSKITFRPDKTPQPEIEFDIIDPNGVTHHGVGIKQFAQNHGLCSKGLGKVLRGQHVAHRGWRLPGQETCYHRRNVSPDFVFDVIDPFGIDIQVTFKNLPEFCRKHGFSVRTFRMMWNRRTKHCGGWTRFDQRDQCITIKHVSGREVTLNVNGVLKDIARVKNINLYALYELIGQKNPRYDGWSIVLPEPAQFPKLQPEKAA